MKFCVDSANQKFGYFCLFAHGSRTLIGRNVLTVRIVDSWQRMKSEFNFPRLFFLYSIFESLSPSACDKLSATLADMPRLLSAHSLNLCSSLFIPSWMLCAFALEQFQADVLEFYSLFCWRCSRCRRLIFINFCYRLSRLFYDLLSFSCLGYKSIYRREEEKKCVRKKIMLKEIENVNKLGK